VIDCGRNGQAIAVEREEVDLTRDMNQCDDDHVLSTIRAANKQQAHVVACTVMSNKENLTSTGKDIAPENPLALGNDAIATDEIGYGCLYTLSSVSLSHILNSGL